MKLICERTTFIPGFCVFLSHHNGSGVSPATSPRTTTQRHPPLRGMAHCGLTDPVRTLARIRHHAAHRLAAAQRLADPQAQARTHRTLAAAYYKLAGTDAQLGRLPQALAGTRRALDLYRALGDRDAQATTLTALGDAYACLGAADEARAAWRSAHRILTELDHPDAHAVREKLQTR